MYIYFYYKLNVPKTMKIFQYKCYISSITLRHSRHLSNLIFIQIVIFRLLKP
jgi:hypothetical protein